MNGNSNPFPDRWTAAFSSSSQSRFHRRTLNRRNRRPAVNLPSPDNLGCRGTIVAREQAPSPTDVMCCKLERIQTSVFMPQGTCLSWPRANRKSSSLIAPNASGCCALPGWPRSFSARSATIWVKCPWYPARAASFTFPATRCKSGSARLTVGFPRPKILKQRVRDQIDPDRDLGHNDRTQ